MNIRDISEVGARLEKIFTDADGEALTPEEQYDLYESIAIQILDSEFMNYGDGELEMYLAEFLEVKANALNIEE